VSEDFEDIELHSIFPFLFGVKLLLCC
jgi:hypothetical protein